MVSKNTKAGLQLCKARTRPEVNPEGNLKAALPSFPPLIQLNLNTLM